LRKLTILQALKVVPVCTEKWSGEWVELSQYLVKIKKIIKLKTQTNAVKAKTYMYQLKRKKNNG